MCPRDLFIGVIITLFLGGVAVAGSISPGDLGYLGGANSNPHNLSSNSSNAIKADTETEICIFCHIPHGGDPQAPLWNRLAPAGPFPLFNVAKVQNAGDTFGIDDPGIIATTLYGTDYPNGSSKLCLSCHDGVSAIGTVIKDHSSGLGITVNSDSATTMGTTSSTKHFDAGGGGGMDLSASHPISFVYTQPVVNHLNTTAVKTDTFQLPTRTDMLDGAYRVQCTTCHQPHKDTRAGGAYLPFWRVTTSGVRATDYDATCDQCHGAASTYAIPNDHNYP